MPALPELRDGEGAVGGVDAFMKKITFQEIMPEGLAYLGKTIEIMADNEKLEAHGNAVRVRNVESKI